VSLASSLRARPELAALSAASAVLLAARLLAAARVGWGDSEALYASYALHPAPAYLDHPGLVGFFASLVGGGTAPSPARAHVATAVLATAFPWLVALTARACGARPRPALTAALVVALVPEIAVGLFAMTPDLLLALAWVGSLGLAAVALRAAPGSGRATAAFAGAGVLAGVAAGSKVTGAALFVVLATAYASSSARAHARSIAPWLGLAAGVVVLLPVVSFEARAGWPMLRHRLVDTQAEAGISLRNVGALAGGQLTYLSPVVAALAVLAARAAWRDRTDAVGRLLVASFLVPLAPLLALCLWSPVAEPHWMAPALLGLAPAAARAERLASRRLVVAACAVAAVMVAAVHAWVLVPASVRLAPASYDPRLDITNELTGWPEAVAAVREEARAVEVPGAERGDVAVVGPHWVICAQLEAALRGELPVGCATPVPDDFDTWLPRARWGGADVVLWVRDARFGAPALPAWSPLREREVRIERGGRTVRVFTITALARRAPA
jgi:hypothetical protein